MAIYLPNVIEYPIIFHGVARLGGVNTTINPQYSPQDLARQLTSSRAKYLITMPSLAERAFRAGVLKELRSVIVIGKAQGCESIASLLLDDGTAFPSNVKINPKEDPVSLPFSSGTTGISKGVVITHYNQVAQLCLLTRDGPSPVIRTWLNVLPFFHTYGLTIVMGLALYSGDKVVILTRFDPEIFLRTIQDYKVRIWLALLNKTRVHPCWVFYFFFFIKKIISSWFCRLGIAQSTAQQCGSLGDDG